MIHLDTSKIGQVDQKSFEEKIEESNKIHVSYVCVCVMNIKRSIYLRDHHDCDIMVVGFLTTYAISPYHH